MSVLQRVVLVVGVVLALGVAAAAVVATNTEDHSPGPAPCLERDTTGPKVAAGPRSSGAVAEYPCVRYGAPAAVDQPFLRSSTAAYWWFGVAAVVVLTGVAVVVTAPRRRG